MAVVRGAGWLILVAGILLGGVVWLYTTYRIWTGGEAALALLSLFVPPADLFLSFYVDTNLGLMGLASIVVCIIGGAISQIGKL